MTAAAPSPVLDGLQQVLAAQHACVFGYPAIGTRLDDPAQIQQARTEEAAHRLIRDALAAQLVGIGATPVAANADYSPPAKLTSAEPAQRWAVALEQQVAVAYRYLLVCCVQAGATAAANQAAGNAPAANLAALRRQALAGLTEAARSATFWRGLISPSQPTVAFPGAQ